ncbi:MAG: hypothetical protein ACRENJ_03130 [Candidatus Eiseniibacteriota bacterium]
MDDAPQIGLPDLRFVAVDALVSHERHDQHRSDPLTQRLREQGVLRNPPVVTPLPPDNQRFVVLDGANRATALREAGAPHIVVQVVHYGDPGIRLTTWHHALSLVPPAQLERALAAIEGLAYHETDMRHARAVLARREAIAFLALREQRAITLHGVEPHRRNDILNAVVDCYRAQARYYRVTSDSLGEARLAHPDVTALVVFPHFEPAEILDLATTGALLPAGITRHVIAWRALRLDVPLERLARSTEALADKNLWLAEWLREKVHQRQVRFYQEPTVLFDE